MSLCEQNDSELVYVVNIIFLPTKFLDLSGIEISLLIKNILSLFCLVKDSHMRYTFRLEQITLKTSNILKENKSNLFMS